MQLEIVPASWAPCTSTRLQDEVSKLWTLIQLVPALNELGNDNQEAIEAQLSALSEGLTLDETLAEFADDSTEPYILEAALAAIDWYWHGGQSPSEEWARIIEKRSAAYFVN